MNKKVLWGSILAVAVGGLITANVYRVNKSIEVTLTPVAEGKIVERIYANGHLESAQVGRQFAPQTGTVKDLNVQIGDRVKKGDVLFTLEARGLAEQKVTAEQDGFLTELQLHEGQMVMEGTPVLVITETEDLRVLASVSELDANKVKTGLPATITGDAFTDTYQGKVTYLSPIAAPAGPASKDPVVEMRIDLDQTDANLRPGYSASVEIELEQPDAHLLAPLTAIKHEGDKSYVFREENGKAVRQEVTLGLEDEEHVEILEGLQAGDKIITDIPDDLKAGKKVTSS